MDIFIRPAFVLESVGTDELHLAGQAAVDGVVIGGQLDRGLLAGDDIGDVLGLDMRLDEQLIPQRGQLDDLFSGDWFLVFLRPFLLLVLLVLLTLLQEAEDLTDMVSDISETSERPDCILAALTRLLIL